MARNEDLYLSLDSNVSKRWSTARIFNVGVAFIGGAFLALLATSFFAPRPTSTSAATSASLFSMASMSRPSSMKLISPGFRGPTLSSLPGPSDMKELALSVIEANNRCEIGGPKPTPRFVAAMAQLKSKTIQEANVAALKARAGDAATLGAIPPLGFWDPAGFSTKASAGRLAYFREAELKHGRVCMIGTLGFFTQERWHPFFGGNIEGPALQQIKSVELLYFWPAIIAISGFVELANGMGRIEKKKGEGRVLKEGLVPGDIGYDPLGIKNVVKESDRIEEKELANGRLAMLSLAGMIMQEVAFPQKGLR